MREQSLSSAAGVARPSVTAGQAEVSTGGDSVWSLGSGDVEAAGTASVAPSGAIGCCGGSAAVVVAVLFPVLPFFGAPIRIRCKSEVSWLS